MKNQRILLLVLPILFLSSCIKFPNVGFVTPQPESLKPLEIIPEKFQGTFVIYKDTIVVTDYTIDGDTINSDSLIVKGWGNYLFINELVVAETEEIAYYRLGCAKSVNVWNNEKISLHHFELDLDEKFGTDFILNTDTAGLSDAEFKSLLVEYLAKTSDHTIVNSFGSFPHFILDDVSVNEFQTFLNKSAENSTKVTRIK